MNLDIGRPEAGSPPKLRRLRFLLGTVAATLAVGTALCLGVARSRATLVLQSLKIGIPLDLQVLDDSTGQPIPGARVDFPWLKPSWRGRAELLTGDTRREIYPSRDLLSPYLTDENGRMERVAMLGRERQPPRGLFGLVPTVKDPEIVFDPTDGARVTADGYETWTEFLEEIREDYARPLKNFAPMPVVVRLKPVSH